MVRRSNKSIAEILTPANVPLQDKNDDKEFFPLYF
jgi:hypothetical protein